jgi:hypothetical protein
MARFGHPGLKTPLQIDDKTPSKYPPRRALDHRFVVYSPTSRTSLVQCGIRAVSRQSLRALLKGPSQWTVMKKKRRWFLDVLDAELTIFNSAALEAYTEPPNSCGVARTVDFKPSLLRIQ